MKKLLALLLALVMVLSLSACGSDVTVDPDAPSDSDAGESVQAPITILFANSNNENTATGQALIAMLDYIEEKTGGAVTFTRHFGASICSAAEEYQYLTDGAIQMGAPKPADFASENPFLYGLTVNTDWDDLWNYWNYIFVENSETATIIEKYTAADGLKVIGSLCSGQGCILGTKEFTHPDDLVGEKLGVVQSPDYWIEKGANVVNTIPPEIYESLSRGVYDYVGFAMSYYLPMSLNEVAPYVMNANEYQSSLTVMVTEDIWNQLTAETQQIFRDAAKLAYDFGVDGADADAAAVEAAAAQYFVLDKEAANEISAYMERSNGAMLIGFAEAMGDEAAQDMLTILKAKADYSGMDVVPDQYK